MFILFAYLVLVAGQTQASEIVYTTTTGKISMSYVKGGATLSTTASAGDRFAMNGQMYKAPGYVPVGLYVENGKTISALNLVNNLKVNFGINPQAVFYIDTNGNAGLVDAKKAYIRAYRLASQIAPMLVQGGVVNPRIRNFKGIGINRNGI